MKLRKFQLSCPVFWGQNKFVDLDKYNNIDAIIKDTLDNFEQFYKEHNLIDMCEYFKKIKKFYHIHDLTLEMIHASKEEDVFYICRHDNCTNQMDKLFINR
jgi:hypothetical protein